MEINDICCCLKKDGYCQRHVHEILGSVMIAGSQNPHTHRFATVSGQAILEGNSHVHEVIFRTDFYEGHFHLFKGTSGIAIPVGNNRHVHFAAAVTTFNAGHEHEFKVAALIDDPTAN